MFSFSDVVFMALCACDNVDYIGSCQGYGVLDGESNVAMGIINEFAGLKMECVWLYGFRR